MTEMLVSKNPARGYAVLGEVAVSSAEEVKEKVALARQAQVAWWRMGLAERKAQLQKLAAVFQRYQDDLAMKATEEMGASLNLTTNLAKRSEQTFQWNLDHADEALATQVLYQDEKQVNEIVYEPYGVMACIVAWNFPYPNFIQSVIPSLLGGNTVVMKYSEEIPLFSKFIESLVEEAGLPEGVISFVYGDGRVGELLVNEEIDLISFTGSYATGQKLYELAAKKFIPIINELGGSSPGIVFADCDLDAAIEQIFWNRFLNTGQFCSNMKRLIVHESLFDACVEKLVQVVNGKVLGDPQDAKTDLGPLVAERQVAQLEAQLEDAVAKGAQVRCGGKRPEGLAGAYFEPTVLTGVTFEMKVWCEEVFGPILPVVPFKTYEEAIALANDTIYGLNALLYTHDKAVAARATQDIQAGTIVMLGTNNQKPQNPFGGYKKSGMGRVRGLAGFHDAVQMKTVARLV